MRLIPIPIGLLISLVTLLSSSIGNHGNERGAARFNEANAAFDRGDFVQAIVVYGEAIGEKPDFWEAYYNRGLAYLDSGDPSLAIADFDRALQLNPGFIRGYFSRGLAYYDLDEADKAIVDFDQAIERTPEFIADRWADAAEEPEGQMFAAMPGYLEGSPDAIDLPRVYVYRGLAYLAQGDDDKALADLDRAVGLQPALSLAHYARGVAHFNMGDYENALADFSKVLELDNDPDVSAEVKALLDELGVDSEPETPWSEQS